MLGKLPRVCVAALLGPAALAAQSGQFVVRLGTDTLAIEQYTRTPDRLQGEQVLRTPRTVHRLYTARFSAAGAIERFEVITHNVAGAPGPQEEKATVEFAGDTAIVTAPRGDSARRRRVTLAPGGVPWTAHCYALVEEVARRARTAGGDHYTTAMLPLGNTAPWTVQVDRLGRDSMTIMLGPIGPLRMHVDDQGTLLGLTGAGSTMQVTVERVHGLDLATVGTSFAPRSLGPLSPPDSIKTTVSGATVAVRYNRPSMRGRGIFGGVVPWNQVWRTGANEATVFETNADLVVAGTAVPAGKYSLWTLPSPSGWTLIVNRNTGQWGTDYDPQYDVARVDMKVERLAQPVEQFTLGIEPQGLGGVMKLEWETTRAWVPIVKR